jgi:predicted MFS family arabinose efflux permease
MNRAEGKYPIAALAVALMLTGTLLPTPLFELYHRTWRLTPAEISLVFAVYAGTLIPALLFLGGLSDTIGRRRTILLAFAILAVATLVFAFAQGLLWLIVGRMIQGFAMGIGLGAGTAAVREWMSERLRPRAGEVTVVATAAGSAAGALLGGAVGQFAPDPLSLPYFVYIALLAGGAALVASVPKCPHLQPAAARPILNVPAPIRRPFFMASSQAFLGWSTFALFVSLVPSFLARALDLHNLLIGASVITCIQVGSVIGTFAGLRLPPRAAIVAAMLALGAGVWLLLIGIALHSVSIVIVATLVAGAGGGLSYMAGLNIINAIAPPDHRAETLSAFLVFCYLGFSVPSLAVGVAANAFGLFAAFVGAAVILGTIAIVVILLSTERNLRPSPAG